jgi:hypothetical protein
MNRKLALLAILALTLTFMGAGLAQAVTSTAPVTISATVSSSATLTLANTTITFANQTPPAAMIATENGSAVTATFRTASTAPGTLTVVASGDLQDGNGDIIAITNLTSTATNGVGSFFSAGPVTWSKTGAGATVGTGPSGTYSGTFSWALVNSWAYPTGTYTSSATYTLTAP